MTRGSGHDTTDNPLRSRLDRPAEQKTPRRRPQERRSASRQGYSIPPVGSITGAGEDGCGNDVLWKPHNGFHRDLEISPRTRDSHIPTADSMWRKNKTKDKENRSH